MLSPHHGLSLLPRLLCWVIVSPVLELSARCLPYKCDILGSVSSTSRKTVSRKVKLLKGRPSRLHVFLDTRVAFLMVDVFLDGLVIEPCDQGTSK